jgi:hypothetical protein
MPYRCYLHARLWLIGLLTAIVATATLGPATAQEWTPFMASGVAVDVTAGSASEARDRALAQGQLLGFATMLRTLTDPADHGRLPRADPATVANMITGFEIEEEKASAVRYIATLTYRFDASSVRTMLQNLGIPFAEGRGRPMLVLPVLNAGGAALLWEEPNPWRDAWLRRARASGLVPLVLPIGDLVDISKVSAEQAMAGDAGALADLAARYQAADVLVVIATADAVAGTVDASAFRYGVGGGVAVARASVAGAENPFADAAAQITARLEADWKSQNMVRADLSGQIGVIVPVQSLSDWTLLRRRLGAVGSIRQARLVRLQRGQAQIDLDFVGTIDQLQRTLAQQGLDLRQGLAAWVLSLPGAAMPAFPSSEPVNAPAPAIQPGPSQ